MNDISRNLASLALTLVILTGAAVARKSPSSPGLLTPTLRLLQDSDTETVLSTFRPQAGKEDELLKTMNQNWATLRRLGLVLAEPHLMLRGKDDSGKTIFVEILTWRDHEAPDHVPPEVQAIWKQLQTLVEDRGGHRGIEFPEFEIVSSAP